MIEVAIMIEGQNGLTWPRWQRLAQAVEDFGFVGLYRSDHYTNTSPPDKESLELWTSLTWLASHTERIENLNVGCFRSSGDCRSGQVCPDVDG